MINDPNIAGVLSHLLWKLVVNKLLKSTNQGEIYGQRYADGIVIIARGKFSNLLTELTQKAQRKVEQRCPEENHRVNPRKSRIVPLTSKHGVLRGRPPVLFRQELLLWKR